MSVQEAVLTGNFNPRSHEGSDAPRNGRTATGTYFNPRSHEGSDADGLKRMDCTGISIHAPTRGATAGSRSGTSRYNNFNPRSHEGSDVNSPPSISFHKISIHAPTRGATILPGLVFYIKLFQSTLPRGERRRCC